MTSSIMMGATRTLAIFSHPGAVVVHTRNVYVRSGELKSTVSVCLRYLTIAVSGGGGVSLLGSLHFVGCGHRLRVRFRV